MYFIYVKNFVPPKIHVTNTFYFFYSCLSTYSERIYSIKQEIKRLKCHMFLNLKGIH